jgi:hypothetical protein
MESKATGQPDEVCPFCGYEFPQQKKTMPVFAWLFAVLMLWPLFQLLKRLL